MKQTMSFTVLMILGLYLPCLAEGPAQPSESVIVSKLVTAPPVIDGKLDDPCWQAAECTRPFTCLGQPHATIPGLWLEAEEKFVKNAATAMIVHDDANLYIACRAPAPKDVPPAAAVTGHDGKVWNDDSVEIDVDPMRLQGTGFYRIVVNAIGTLTDVENTAGSGAYNFGWETKATVKTATDGTGFIVEIAIPLAAFGDIPHNAGTTWGINVYRRGPSGGGESTWAPVGKDFWETERFGLLIFENRKAYHQQRVSRLIDTLRTLPTDKSPELAKSVKQAIPSLKQRIEREGNKASSWSSLRVEAEAIEGTLRQIAMLGRSCLLWQKTIWGPISPDEKVPPDTKPLTTIDIFSAQNTRANSGFLITNISTKPLMGRLRFVKSQAANTLGCNRIHLRRGVYVELANGKMVPDALVQLLETNLVEVPPRTTTLVWMEIDAHGLAPGSYSRTIEFFPSYAGFDRTTFDIHLQVAPVDLSAPKVRQFTYIGRPERMELPVVVADLVKHGMTTIYFLPGAQNGYSKFDAEGNILTTDLSTLDAMIKNMYTAGLTKKELTVLIYLNFSKPFYRNLPRGGKGQLKYGSEAWKKGFAGWLGVVRDHLFDAGLTSDDFAFYTVDEPCGDPANPNTTAYFAFESAKFIKQVDPKLRTITNPCWRGEDLKRVADYIKWYDILMPYRRDLDSVPALVEQLRASGREIWTYQITDKTAPVEYYRNLFWASLRDGFGGTSAFWAYEVHSGDGFYSHDTLSWRNTTTADYGVVYGIPYNDKDTEDVIGIIPSRRWEAWYQGTQDVRAVMICRELIAKLDAAGKDTSEFRRIVADAIASAVGKSSADMDAARKTLILAAVRMNQIIKE